MAVTVVQHPSGEGARPGGQPGRRAAWPRWPRPTRPDLFAVGAYLLLAGIVCATYWVDVQHRISSHLPADHSWFEWLLSHGAYSVRHLENPLFSARQNAPDGVNMMANTSVLGISLPLAPLTMLAGPQVAYVVYLGGALAATASTCYWALSRHLVTSRAAAFVGGAFVGFAPGIVHHANGQPNFVANFLLPLILVRVSRLGQPGRWLRNGVILGLLVAYQLFINEEMLLLTALAALVAVAVHAAQHPARARAAVPSSGKALAMAATVALALTGYPIWFQFTGPQSYRGLQGGVFHNWGEDLAAFVTYSRDTLAGSPAVEQTIGRTEQNTWFGWPLVVIVLLLVMLLWRVSSLARTATVVGVVFAVASTGPRVRVGGQDIGVPGPWQLIPDNLPLVEMMMPTRLSLVLVGVVGLLLALGWDHLGAVGRRRRPLRVLGYAVLVLALLPLLPQPLPARYVDAPPRFITSGAWRPYVPTGRTLVPVPLPSNVHGLSTLRWSALTGHEFAVPAGYFIGPDRQGRGIFGAPLRPTTRLVYDSMDRGAVPPVTEKNRRQAIDDLRYWKASAVVLGEHPRLEVLRALMTQLLGPPQRVDDVWLWDVRPLVG